jgi:hypothetical protein
VGLDQRLDGLARHARWAPQKMVQRGGGAALEPRGDSLRPRHDDAPQNVHNEGLVAPELVRELDGNVQGQPPRAGRDAYRIRPRLHEALDHRDVRPPHQLSAGFGLSKGKVERNLSQACLYTDRFGGRLEKGLDHREGGAGRRRGLQDCVPLLRAVRCVPQCGRTCPHRGD